jgi:hypothetical protein
MKIAPDGVISTYQIIYVTSSGYFGGVLDANGEIQLCPAQADVGQKISKSLVASTYSMASTITNLIQYSAGGVLAPDGTIYWVPYTMQSATPNGRKLSPTGVTSTYSIVIGAFLNTYIGGVINLNNEIHFIPFQTGRGMKINLTTTQYGNGYSLGFGQSKSF